MEKKRLLQSATVVLVGGCFTAYAEAPGSGESRFAGVDRGDNSSAQVDGEGASHTDILSMAGNPLSYYRMAFSVEYQ